MLKYLIILLFWFEASSQQIIPLRGERNFAKNVYYKDTFDDFDNFIGTWKYTLGNTELIVTLHKQASYYNDFIESQEDIVYGEYKYVENGVEKINTLPNLSAAPADRYTHNIIGNILVPECSTCPINNRKLILFFNDPAREHVKGLRGRIILRRVDSGGQQKLEMSLISRGNISAVNGNAPEFDSLNVPWGNYVLVKQP